MSNATPLIITPTLPPVTGKDRSGLNGRLSMFIDALAQQASYIRIVRIVPEDVRAQWAETPESLNALESRFWGQAVRVFLVGRRRRPESFYNHYLRGIFRGSEQPEFFAYSSPNIRSAIQKHADDSTSSILLHRLASVYAYPSNGNGKAKIYFDLDDVEHRVRYRKLMQPPFWPGKHAYWLHIPAMMNAERRSSKRAYQTFVCSAIDQKLLTRLNYSNVAVIPNAVQIPHSSHALTTEPNILFLGLMEYEPNVDAVTRLANAIMPKIWQEVPNAKLILAGTGSESLPFEDPQGRIEKLGFVADLDALYARARIVCCPLRNGGGTRIKLIEAAAYAKPMVTTAVGNEGLDFHNDKEVLIRDTDEEIARACASLLTDVELCKRLASSAHKRMKELYERSAIVKRIADIMNN